MSSTEAERYFHDKIPITRAMGVRVTDWNERGLVVEAPVSLNHNHLQTAFGGSINAVATLAAYGLLWLTLRDEHAHVVVAESSIRFHRPIREQIRATCAQPNAPELANFFAAMRNRGKARLTLNVRVEENGLCAAEFTGSFVAFQNSARST